MIRTSLIIKLILVFFLFMFIPSCASFKSKPKFCGEATSDYFVPLNDWVPVDLRLENHRLVSTIKPIAGLESVQDGSDCSQGAYKECYVNDKRYLFKRFYSVSLEGQNLCIEKPEVYLWKSYKDKNEALNNFYIENSNNLNDIFNLLTQTIQAQCGHLPDTVTIHYIMRAAYADKASIIKKEGIDPRDFDYYYVRGRGASVEYKDIYRGTFYPKLFLSGYGLLTSDGFTSENTSLQDDEPEIRQNFVEAHNRFNESIARYKRSKEIQREQEIERTFGPVAAFTMAYFQKFAMEFADEGVCFFLTHDRMRFTLDDYIKCHTYLNDFQKQLKEKHKESYELGQLIASMSKNQPRLVAKGTTPADRKIRDAMNKCAKAIVAQFGSQLYGEYPTGQSLRDACSKAALKGLIK